MNHKKNPQNGVAVTMVDIPKTLSRAAQVLKIVATDNTFKSTKLPTDPLANRDGSARMWVGNCIHCCTKLVVYDDGSTSATIEHITPTAAGGSDEDLFNLALACARCNNEKGIRHDARRLDARAKEVIENLKTRRLQRWRAPATLT
jgi:5-methylcytosine-specific restriction endonuclease McrA